MFDDREFDQELYDAKVKLAYQLPDITKEIDIKWCIEDVFCLDPTLTPRQASEVLENAKNKHDAEVGINWDGLQYWIYMVKIRAAVV